MIEHVAIIMDGDRRWAARHGRSEQEGRQAGTRAARAIVETAAAAGVKHLTLFAPEEEEAGLDLLSALPAWLQVGLRLCYVGRGSLPAENIAALKAAERDTADRLGMSLNLVLDYDGRIEIADAAARVAEEIEQGHLAPEDAGEEQLVRHFYRPGIPDIDLLVRTGGETRLAGFMLWQTAYAEIVFTDKLWPDFTPADLAEAMDEFGRRVRKFGAIDTI